MILLLACCAHCKIAEMTQLDGNLKCKLESQYYFSWVSYVYFCEIVAADFSSIITKGSIKTITVEFEYEITKMDPNCFIGFDNLESFTLINTNNSPYYISDGAFKGLSKLVTVSLGSSENAKKLKSIGVSSFEGCKSLKIFQLTVATIPERAFYGCDSFDRFTGNYMAKNYAFANCKGLKVLELRGNTEGYGEGLCENCTSLTTANIVNKDNKVPPSLGARAFYGCISLNSSNVNVSSIGASAFENCRSLVTLIVSSATSVGESTFKNCILLPNAVIEGLSLISDSTFENCTSLQSATFKIATSVGNSAFEGCTSLTSADISVAASIGSSSFRGCSNLVSISFGAKSYGDYAFYNCKKLANLMMKQQASFGVSTFAGCESIKSLSMNVFSIGNSVFKGCIAFENVTLKQCTSVGSNVFDGCTSLSNVVISGLRTCIIGDNIFFNCPSIKTLNIFGKSIGINSLTNSMVETANITLGSGLNTIFKGSKTINALILNVSSLAPHSFEECSNLETVNLNGVDIGKFPDYCFKDCFKLQFISGLNVNEIGEHAFHNCKALGKLTIPEKVSIIRDYAYYGISISTIFIPAATYIIGANVFKGNKKMTSIQIHQYNTAFKVVNNILYTQDLTKALFYPEGIASPPGFSEKTTSIGSYAFSDCSFKNISIGTDIKNIDKFAFASSQLLDVKFCRYRFFDFPIEDITVFQGCSPDMKVYVSSQYPFDKIYGAPAIKVLNENCLPIDPTTMFSYSTAFTNSQHFSVSKEFISSNLFSISNKFSHSSIFGYSKEYSKSNQFIETKEFINTNKFSSSENLNTKDLKVFCSSFHSTKLDMVSSYKSTTNDADPSIHSSFHSTKLDLASSYQSTTNNPDPLIHSSELIQNILSSNEESTQDIILSSWKNTLPSTVMLDHESSNVIQKHSNKIIESDNSVMHHVSADSLIGTVNQELYQSSTYFNLKRESSNKFGRFELEPSSKRNSQTINEITNNEFTSKSNKIEKIASIVQESNLRIKPSITTSKILRTPLHVTPDKTNLSEQTLTRSKYPAVPMSTSPVVNTMSKNLDRRPGHFSNFESKADEKEFLDVGNVKKSSNNVGVIIGAVIGVIAIIVIVIVVLVILKMKMKMKQSEGSDNGIDEEFETNDTSIYDSSSTVVEIFQNLNATQYMPDNDDDIFSPEGITAMDYNELELCL